MKTTHLLAMVVAASQTLAALRAQEDGGMKTMDKREHRDLMPTHVMMQEMQAAQDAEIDKLLAEIERRHRRGKGGGPRGGREQARRATQGDARQNGCLARPLTPDRCVRSSIRFWAVRARWRQAFWLVSVVTGAMAQVSPEEHASHHPGGEEADGQSAESGGGMGPGNKKGPGPGAGGGGMMGGGAGGGGGMGGMMEKMGAPKPKDLYPSLISLPELTPEKRAEIEEQARERMKTGSVLLSEGLGELEQSSATADLPAMQAATARMREGLARYDSGLAARRALAEGKPPRDIALEWFKTEMSLPTGAAVDSQGWIDERNRSTSSPSRFSVAFAAIMIWMYFFKMKSRVGLAGEARRRRAGQGAEAAKASPPTGPDPGAPAEAAPAAAPKKADESVAATAADCCAPSDETCPTGRGRNGPARHFGGGLPPDSQEEAGRFGSPASPGNPRRENIPAGRLSRRWHPVQLPARSVPHPHASGSATRLIRRATRSRRLPPRATTRNLGQREEHGAGRAISTTRSRSATRSKCGPQSANSLHRQEAEDIVLIWRRRGDHAHDERDPRAHGHGLGRRHPLHRRLQRPRALHLRVRAGRLQQRHPNLHLFVAMSDLDEEREITARPALRDLLAEWVPGIVSSASTFAAPRG